MSAETQQTIPANDVDAEDHDAPANPSSSGPSKHLRMRTNTAEIDSTITHPGSVKINVKGAFIVDQDAESPKSKLGNGASYDTKDIRLPNHTAVVSHIAVDVRILHTCVGHTYLTPTIFTECILDWRILSQTCIFFARTTFEGTRRTAQFHEFRNRQNR